MKEVFWKESRGKRRTPRTEETFQILLFDKFKTHPLSKKVLGVREPEITGRKKPDILIACKAPHGEILKVYIEMKQQSHPKLLTAIERQLADKYLKDPEAKYGIYLVGWYGQKHYGPSLAALKDKCGEVPSTAKALEYTLQRLCDEVVAKRHDIEAIKAVVVDLELN